MGMNVEELNDLVDQQFERLGRLCAERDALTGTVRAYEQSFKNLSEDCDALAERLEKAERAVREMRDERNAAVDRADALAAHAEEGREAVEHARQWVPQHVWTRLWLWKVQSRTTSLDRLKAEWQAEVLDRLKELLKDTHMDKAPTVARASLHVDDAINRIKQECAPLLLTSTEGGE